MSKEVKIMLLGEVAKVVPGVATRTPIHLDGDRRDRLLTVRALTDTGIDADGLAELDVLGKISDDQRLQSGDVLLPARSTRVLAVVVPERLAGIPINATLVIVRCGPSLNPHVLAAYLNHPDGQLAIAAVAQSGTAQMNLTAAALCQLLVPVFPQDQQARFALLLASAEEAHAAAIEAAGMRLRLARSTIFDQLTQKKEG